MFERLDPKEKRTDADLLNSANYEVHLRRTLDTYPLADFSVLDDPNMSARRFAIIRHDVDLRPKDALAIAEIEQRLGVRAVYMVLLTSEFYNLLDSTNRAVLRSIDSLGHQIGLHFDALHHRISREAELSAALRVEAALLSDLVGKPVESFSFHNTTPFTMSCREDRYAGLYNAYAGRIQDQVSYVSDSNGMWRFESWRERLQKQPERLQVLTHPEHWRAIPGRATERVADILGDNAREVWQSYCELLLRAERTLDCDDPQALQILAETGDSRAFAIMFDWTGGRQFAALAELAALLAVSETHNPSELSEVLADLAQGIAVDVERRANAFVTGARLFASTICA